MKLSSRFVNFVCGLLLCLVFSSAMADEKVKLHLKWRHAFQFAGYYAAIEKGYYRDAGLDVELIEGTPKSHATEEVLSGRAHFGVGTSSLLLERRSGKPLVVLANIFQHSPQILIARQFSENQSVHDLTGRRLMLEPQSEELLAYLKAEGIQLSSLRIQTHNFSIADLIQERTDVISAYSISEPFHLDRAGLKYFIYSPRSAGIDFYGDNLFTTEAEVAQHPERVENFLRASLKGWEYALSHQNEIIDLILKKYPVGSGEENDLPFLQFEAKEVASLVRKDLVGVGYINKNRWKAIADVYAGLEMLPENFSLAGFLYEPAVSKDYKELSKSFYFLPVTLGTFLLLLGVFYIVRSRNRNFIVARDLQECQERLRLFTVAIEHSPAPIMITGPDSVIEYVNPEFTKVTGYSIDDLAGFTPRILKSGLTRPETYQAMWEMLLHGQSWSGELVNRRKSGEIYWEEAHISPVFNDNGELTHYVAVKRDITERKIANEKLAFMAHHDSLTGLPNRAYFFEKVHQFLKSAQRNQRRIALLFIDLENFKLLNDSYGHAVGDLVLQEVAQRMVSAVRETDILGRIGGDEFVALLPDLFEQSDAIHVSRKLSEVFKKPFRVSQIEYSLGVSIGIAFYPEHGEDERSLAKSADVAMYCAKSLSDDNICIFSYEMRDRQLHVSE